MNIITVIPLTRSKIASELSYFTAAVVPVGAIVSVPLRSRAIHAIVVKSQNAEELKIDIKNAPFEIRKLGKIKATVFFPPSFIEACGTVAEFYATTMGAVIDAMVADTLMENASKISPPLPKQPSLIMDGTMTGDNSLAKAALKPRPDSERIFAVQGDDADRMSSWRSLIRQEFARKRSIAMYAPTIEDCQNIFKELEKGIEGYIFILHSGLPKKKISETWNLIAETDHPVVVIATGSFSLLPRGDIDTTIIERENNRGWIGQKAPYLDIRFALEMIARLRRQTIFLADSLLRVETLHRLDEENIHQGSPFKWRSISNAKDSLVDMKAFKSAKNDFKIISPDLERLIRTNHEENTHLFIFSLRRGLASMTVCDDCETVVTCRNCSAPIVLHTSSISGKNFFMCHKCGERRSAEEMCAVCGGWRLTPLGIGIDRVAEELRTRFPEIDVFQIDADTTKTPKQMDETLNRFRSKPGSILLGTESALLHLTDKVDHVAVASLDSLFALPDFRIQEKIMYMLIRLRVQATRSILVQTRQPEEKVFEYGLKGNLSDFYRLTLSDRKQFKYPPFSILIKLTIEGKKDKISVSMASVQQTLTPYEVDVFPAFTSTLKGNSVIHGLLSVEPHSWPDPELIAKLRSLPSNVLVKVNPETLL
jgi:primosomal protein N' (replication factor Y)